MSPTPWYQGSVRPDSEGQQTGFQSEKHCAYRTRIPVSFRWSSRPHQCSFLSLSYHTRLASDSFVTGTPHSLTRFLVCLHSLYACWEKLRICSIFMLWNCRWELHDGGHMTFLLQTGWGWMRNKKLKPRWISNCPDCKSTNLNSIHHAFLLSA